MRRALYIVLPLLAAWLLSQFVCQLMLIQGESMAPAYHNLQLVLLNKLDRKYQAGDVIAFRCDGLHTVLVKRVAACPGDTVHIEEGTLYVNDAPSSVYPEGRFLFAGIASETLVLDEDEFFVIGDNVDLSKDSRYAEVGLVDEESIFGKIL